MNPTVVVLGHADARALIDQIKVSVSDTWNNIVTAYLARAWEPLGYGSWADLCAVEFSSFQLRLPREALHALVIELRVQGMSVRSIAAATGASKSTVSAIAPPVQNWTPGTEQQVSSGRAEEDLAASVPLVADQGDLRRFMKDSSPPRNDEPDVRRDPAPATVAASTLGMDGKRYPRHPPVPRERRRRPLPDAASKYTRDLEKALVSLQRLVKDGRFNAHKDRLAISLRSRLVQANTTLTKVVDSLPDITATDLRQEVDL